MTGTIFDLIEDDLPEGQEGFMELAAKAPEPKNDSFINSISDYAKTFLKGSIEGVSRLGRMMGPLMEDKSTPQLLEEQTETLNKLLPTDEGYVRRGLRRGLREAPSMMAFPGTTLQTLPRSIAAGFAGEGAKDLGAPEWAQSASELSAFIGPDLTKKLLASGKNAKLIDFAKKMGMSDAQITPLIQSEFKQKWLSKLAPKRGATEKALKSTKSQLDQMYSSLQKSESAANEFMDREGLAKGLLDKLTDMPHEVREKIKPDLNELFQKKITGESLINFWKDINHHYPKNKQLGTLKEPIKNAIESISPELGHDFEMVNKLYTKYYPIAEKLKPTIASDLVNAAETIGLLGGLVTGNYPTLTALLSEKAFSKASQQLLINPRLQQLSKKMIEAMNQNKGGIVKKLTEAYSNQVRKENPELAAKLDRLSLEEIEDFLNPHREDATE